MTASWRSRPATKDDGAAIARLFEAVFNEKQPISHWRWKYVDNATKMMCTVVAEDSQGIVGQCALLPTWMNLRGLRVLGAQRVDSMVHPDYRHQGMFAALAKDCYALAGAQGIKLMYHFPNEQSLPVSVKELGSDYVGELVQLVKVLNPRAVIQHRLRSAHIASIGGKCLQFLLALRESRDRPIQPEPFAITKITRFDDRFDRLWLTVKDRFPIAVWKDSSYLNWRYLSCPDREYSVLAGESQGDVAGFIVLRFEEGPIKRGYIVDYLFAPEKPAAASRLIQAGLDHLKERGPDIVLCRILQDSPYRALYKRQGFLKRGEHLRLLARPLASDVDPSTISDLKEWHVVAGDVDVF
ncbi:MAG: GNAT family N-acetyltransferase [Dehalococcoidia bacterium]|nr:GNAT family N-acetyltransferase [Dehalococcoidia bacterium]